MDLYPGFLFEAATGFSVGWDGLTADGAAVIATAEPDLEFLQSVGSHCMLWDIKSVT